MATGKFPGEAQLETKYTYFFHKRPLIRNSTLRTPKNLETQVLGKYNLSNYSFLTKEILDIFYLTSLVSCIILLQMQLSDWKVVKKHCLIRLSRAQQVNMKIVMESLRNL